MISKKLCRGCGAIENHHPSIHLKFIFLYYNSVDLKKRIIMRLKTLLFTLSTLCVFSSLEAMESAEALYDTKCASCHQKTIPQDISSLVAPPAMGVMRHVKMKYPDRASAIAFISEYVLNPQQDKAVCLPERIKAFGLMPSQKGLVNEAELSLIAGWMYDNFPPSNRAQQGRMCPPQGFKTQKAVKIEAFSPFLISSGLPHMTKLLMQHGDDPELALSEDQKRQLLIVRKTTMQNVKRLSPQIEALESKIKTMTMEGETTQTLFPMIERLSQLKAEITKVHIRCIHDTKSILTQEQTERLLQK
jgi:hypothetical protein